MLPLLEESGGEKVQSLLLLDHRLTLWRWSFVVVRDVVCGSVWGKAERSPFFFLVANTRLRYYFRISSRRTIDSDIWRY